MKRYLTILTIMFSPFMAEAQLSYPDSLRKELQHATTDSVRFQLNSRLSGYYEERKPDSAIFYGDQALIIARKNKKQLAIASALLGKAFPLRLNGKYGEALGYLMEALAILEDPASEKNNWRFDSTSNFFTEWRLSRLSAAHHVYALLEADMGNIDQELFHYSEEIRVAEIIKDSFRIQVAYMNLGNTYRRLGKPDSALYYGLRSDSMAKASGILYYNGWNLGNIGDVYFNQKNNGLAKKYYYEALKLSEKKNEGAHRAAAGRLFRIYLSEKNADSSLYFANQQINSTFSNDIIFLTDAYENLYRAYALKGQSDSADKYLKLAFNTRDSAWKKEVKNLTDFQQLTTNEQLRLRKLEKEKVEYQAKIRTWSLLAGLGVFLLIALLLFRNNRLKKRSNQKLESTLSNLRNTQSQLIQSEKMASLGELTAGIAHEIQNPLNFVNNFSEVNKELADELEQEIDKGNYTDAKAIAKDIKENEQKINHHGKRADTIVKGMLQHSRSSSGQKEPTDINALADEYLRLAYHGLRAKDKSFNAKFETDFDSSLEKINVVPQDIGRVILNLINNAFYACAERSRSAVSEKYEPTVIVSTKKLDNKIEVKVKDNGGGIPQKVLDKIFQPFFTTKPTGQGTGLGLSLSYDIVKAHGGEIRVRTKEAEGTEFIINLPR